MFESKFIFAVLAIAFEISSNLPYIRDTIAGHTKPHFFTWFIWTILSAISLSALLSEGAGSGAWVVGVTTISCAIIAVFALFRGEKRIITIDWFSFLIALIAIAIWVFTSDPFLTIVSVLVAEVLGFFPTIRKSFSKPEEETASTYILTMLKHLCTFLALQAYAPSTVLFVGFLFTINAAFVGLLFIQRAHLGHIKVA